MRRLNYIIISLLIAAAAILVYRHLIKFVNETKALKQVISRLQADSRIAEVLVSDVYYDEDRKKNFTTIKFLEYDVQQRPLKPKYFTFAGNIIQFQSLVVRFDDLQVRLGAPLKGRSAYIFWKVFMLDGPNTQEYEINKMQGVPRGYQIGESANAFEEKLWQRFWDYALNAAEAKGMGIKNAQIEAPGTMFVPGTFYTIKIEHDGGMRIDAQPLPAILKGEHIPGSI